MPKNTAKAKPTKADNEKAPPKKVDASKLAALSERALKQNHLVDIGPDLAQQLLDNKLRTRSIRAGDLNRYAASMDGKDGKSWKSQASAPICITEDGKLADGQHRMSAVVKSGKTVPFYIQMVKPDDIDVMDTGVRRTGADVVFQQFGDLPHEKARSFFTALLWAHTYDKKQYAFTLGRLTNDQVKAEMKKYPDLMKSVDFVHEVAPKNGALLAKGQGAFLHYVMANIDSDLANKFIEKFYKGTELAEGHVLHTLRQRFVEDKDKTEKLSLKAKTAMLIKAWNATRKKNKNAPLKELAWAAKAPFPRAL